MPTLPNMSLITPTAGADSGTWDDKINACFALLDAHDHTSGKGAQVPVSGLNINADFAMGGNAVTGLASIAFNAVTALVSGSKRLFVSSADNELYWRTNAGTNVKLTDGASINTTLVGGIVGDYSSVGAEVAYSDADQVYTFKDESAPTKKWARLGSGPVRIYEYDTTESVYVEHAVAAALAAPYTVTWPAALPGAQAAVQIGATGTVIFSNTFTAALTAPDFLFTTERTKVLAASALQRTGSTHVFNGSYWALGNSTSDTLYASLPLDVGDRIKSVKLWLDKNSDNTNTITFELFRSDPAASGGVATSLGTATNSGAANGITTQPTISGLTTTVAVGHAYAVAVYQSDSSPSSSDFIFTVEVTYDRPV